MGFNEIGISFAVSIAANIATSIISRIKGNKNLDDKINDCFNKALYKWDMPQETRENMQFNSIKFYSDLKLFFKDPAKGIHPKVKELLQLWVLEMQNDKECFEFIMSLKQDINCQKTDEILYALKYEVKPQLNDIFQNLNNINLYLPHIIDKLNSSGTDEVLATKLEGVLNGSVASLIESLKFDSARKIICELETQFSKTIDNNCSLKALVHFSKSQILMFTNRNSAFDLVHTAYTLEPLNKKYIREEFLRLLFKKDYSSARLLLSKLPDENKYIYLLNVLSAEDRRTAYESTPEDIKDDYDFKENLLEIILSDNSQDISFIFPDDKIITPSSFSFSTLKSWLFAATIARFRSHGFITLTLDDQQIKVLSPYQKVVEDFYNQLLSTEIHDYFPIINAIHFYWKYLSTRDCYWLNEFQKLDKKQFDDQRAFFEMVESSMLILENRQEEAFAIIVGINSNMDSKFIQYVVMVSIISDNIQYLQWILKKVKDLNIKLDSNISLYIAHSINKVRADETKAIITDIDFCNPTDKIILMQLCNYYSGNKMDISVFRDHVDTLDDGMKAYAANLLADNGDTLLAFNMLKPIVDETKQDFKQNVFLSILDRMSEKNPDLYNILIKNRKQGNHCNDNILNKEFSLDIKISDYENALEAITELHNRHPDDIRIFTNYIFTLSHVHPELLSKYEEKALSFHTEDYNEATLLYRTFSENKYLKTATEILYRAAKSSEDLRLRTFFHNEALTGLIRSIVQEEKDVSGEGDFVLCDINGKRVLYKATEFGSSIGKDIMGAKKGNIIETEISFKTVQLTVIGVFNKYYKLVSDIMHEAQDGSNPGLTFFKIDTEKPAESIEEILHKIYRNGPNLEEQKKKAYADYDEGKLTLLNLVDEINPIASYYKLLFTPFKVHVNCCMIEINKMPKPQNDSVFILDTPTIITLTEFTAKKKLKISGPMYVTTIQKDIIETINKEFLRLTDHDIYEALTSDCLVKYSENVEYNAATHIGSLLTWIHNNCKVIVPDTALALKDVDNNSAKIKLISSMTMLTKPEYYYVTDDIHIKNLLPYDKIISSETFVMYFNSENISKAYSQFLFECNFRGVYLDDDYIYKEYKKMKEGMENRMVDIMQNMVENPYLITSAITCCMKLAFDEIDKDLLKLTFTNMFVMALKGFVPQLRDQYYEEIYKFLSLPVYNIQFTRNCLKNAMLIVNRVNI